MTRRPISEEAARWSLRLLSVSSDNFRSVISWCTARNPIVFPLSSRIGLFVPAMGTSRPFLVLLMISSEIVPPARSVSQKCLYCSSGTRPDLRIRGVFPMASSLVKPYTFSKAGFVYWIVPSTSVIKTALSERSMPSLNFWISRSAKNRSIADATWIAMTVRISLCCSVRRILMS